MLLHLRQRKRKEWPAPVEPLGRRGGGPSSQGLLSHWTLVPFFDLSPEFFLCGNLETSLGGCAGRGGGCGVGCRGGGCWGLWRRRLVGWCRGGGCWEPRRGWLVGWYGAPWGWVLGAVEGVSGAPWGWVLGAGEGWWRDGTGCRGREGAGEPRQGRAGAPVDPDKPPSPPPSLVPMKS